MAPFPHCPLTNDNEASRQPSFETRQHKQIPAHFFPSSLSAGYQRRRRPHEAFQGGGTQPNVESWHTITAVAEMSLCLGCCHLGRDWFSRNRRQDGFMFAREVLRVLLVISRHSTAHWPCFEFNPANCEWMAM